MEKILFATDFSENSKLAFGYAIQFAKQFNAEVSLVHIYRMPVSYDNPYKEYTVEQEKLEVAAAHNRLYRMCEPYSEKEDSSFSISYKVVKDPSPLRGILDTIKEDEPDMLMLSTIGGDRTGVFVFKTIIKRLVRECPIPVLTIPPEAKYRDISKVLFTTNYHLSDIIAMKGFINLLDPAKPSITMAHVRTNSETDIEVGEAFWEMVKTAIEYEKLKCSEMSSSNVYSRLNEYIVAEQPNILVMTDQDNGPFYDLFHTDLIKKMKFHSSTPVLTYNAIGLSRLSEQDLSMATGERA